MKFCAPVSRGWLQQHPMMQNLKCLKAASQQVPRSKETRLRPGEPMEWLVCVACWDTNTSYQVIALHEATSTSSNTPGSLRVHADDASFQPLISKQTEPIRLSYRRSIFLQHVTDLSAISAMSYRDASDEGFTQTRFDQWI